LTAERLKTAAAAAAAIAVLVAVGGCGGGGGDDPEAFGTAVEPSSTAAEPPRSQAETEALTPSNCPAGMPACRTAEGRIVFLERVDPDGDGDAHFVIADPQGISLPGITAIDVRRGLRPDPLPGIGERISAAGPVQTGSYGQSQIHAIELHVAGE
jgi:hypothetical protein